MFRYKEDWFRKNRIPSEFADEDTYLYYLRHSSNPPEGISRDINFYNPSIKQPREIFKNAKDYIKYKGEINKENRFLHGCTKDELWNERTQSCSSLIKTDTTKRRFVSSDLCQQIAHITKGKLIGQGTEGSIYIYCNVDDCNYVSKITKKCDDDKIDEIKMEIEMNNKAESFGLAYKIYDAQRCDNQCVTIMDLAKGKTINDLISENIDNDKFIYYIDLLLKSLDKLHSRNLYHGDTNFQNQFVFNDELKFIDFTYWDEFKYYWDFCQMFYYLPSYVYIKSGKFVNAEIIFKVYKLILSKLKEFIKSDEFINRIFKVFMNKDFTLLVRISYLRDFVHKWIWRRYRDIRFFNSLEYYAKTKKIMQEYVGNSDAEVSEEEYEEE